MRKAIVLGVFALLLLAPITSSHASSQNDDKTTISEFCSTHNDLGLSHGGCVAYFVTRNLVPHNASVCQNESFQELLGVSNHGQCVKKLGEMAK
jgi:hypothetical protein